MQFLCLKIFNKTARPFQKTVYLLKKVGCWVFIAGLVRSKHLTPHFIKTYRNYIIEY